jgi:hypothetical protein
MPSLTDISEAVAYFVPNIHGGNVFLRSVEFPQSQELPRHSCNLKVYYYLHKSPPPEPIVPAASSPQTRTDNPFLHDPILMMILLRTCEELIEIGSELL